MLGGTITRVQCAFVEGRRLLDAVLVANEVVEDLVLGKGRGYVTC